MVNQLGVCYFRKIKTYSHETENRSNNVQTADAHPWLFTG